MSSKNVLTSKYLHKKVKIGLYFLTASLKHCQICNRCFVTCGIKCLLFYKSRHNFRSRDANGLKLIAVWVVQVSHCMFSKTDAKCKIMHEL